MKRFLFPVLLFVAFCNTAKAQDFSNKGTEFWIAYPAHIDGTGSAMGIYITSDVNATGTIKVGSNVISFTVAANSVTRKFIGPNATGDAPNTTVYLSTQDGIQAGAGIHVTSDKPVAVYSHIIRSARSAATLVLPTKVWGKKYIVPSYRNEGNQGTSEYGYGEVAVMAAEANTTLQITPSVASRNGTRTVGVPFQITLANPGDVYQLQFTRSSDISGTKIESVAGTTGGCKPITVFSATTWSAFDCTSPMSSGGDNLYQQLFPTGSWGKQFLVAPFKNRSYDIVRVFVDDPSTIITKTENGVTTQLTGLTNSYYEFRTSNPVFIQADKPVSLAQYMVSQSCDSRNGTGCGGNNQPACPFPADPEMVVINPVEQTISDITVFSAHRNFVPQGQSAVTQCFLNIIIKTSAVSTFKINNQKPSGTFVPIPSTPYSYLQEDVTSLSLGNPVQTLTADSGFIAVAYGYGPVESYGYNAGTNVKDLYQYITLQNQYAIINEPATCKNTPFFFSITLPYQPVSITWDFNNNPNLSPNTNYTNSSPVPDSTFIKDGKTLYVYKQKANTYTFSAIGAYPVKVIVNNQTAEGCPGIQEITYDVNVYDPPVADFSLKQSGCVSDTTFFSDSTNGFNRPVVKWRWDFGDGSIDSVKNPIKVFTAPGTYNVKLFSITDVGCINEVIKPVVITTKPQASFTNSTNTCAGNVITFNEASTVSSGTIVKWIWKFGEGTPVTNTSNAAVTHTYNSVGKYTASLEVETSTGCKSTLFTKEITINANPVVDFTFPAVVCLPSGETQFTNNSSISDGSALSYSWNFGDNATSSLANPLHKYTSAGPFNVQLTATSNLGCTKDVTKSVNTILPQPKAGFIISAEACLGDSTSFTDQSNGSGSNITQWKWSFGDGGTSTLKNPKYVYKTAGTQTASLYVITDKGCISDTVIRTTIVNPLPVADFITSVPSCETKEITFTNQSVTNAGIINKWTWNFGDGSAAVTYSAGTPFTRSFSKSGSFAVALDVETDKGCKRSVTKTVIVNPQPVANIILPEVCLNDAFAQFTDSSFIADGSQGSFTYQWNFGDNNATPANPNTSALKDPRHKYSSVGTYKVTMTVTSKDGCSSTITEDFTVNGSIPVAGFNVLNSSSLCSNTKVEVQNTSTVDFGAITKVEIVWDALGSPSAVFTDDNPSSNKIYSHNYPSIVATRNYQIKFRAYSGGSCVNETTQTITVSGSPKVLFSAMPDACSNAAAFKITQASETAGAAGTFVFAGKGVSPAGIFTPASAGVGQTPITYTYTTASGCKDSATQTITVLANPVANAGRDLFILEGGSVTINASATGNNLSYLWTPGTYLNNATILNPVISPLADITYKLTVTGTGGCTGSDDLFVKVLLAPEVPNAFSPNKDGINDTWNIQFLETYPGAVIEVFNRYGKIVFKSVGYEVAWNGTFNGMDLPVGVYYYIINPKNGRKQLTGSVSILR